MGNSNPPSPPSGTDNTGASNDIDKIIDTALHPERNGLLIKEQVAEGADHEWLVKRELKTAIQNLIAQEANKAATQAKISLLTQLAHKPTPTGDDIHPEYTKGFDEMKGKVKFELRRLTADKEQQNKTNDGGS